MIYQPYQSHVEGSRDTALRFLKIPNPYVPRSSTDNLSQDQERLCPLLQSLHDVGGFSAVFMAGTSPAFVIKSASCPPHVIGVSEASVKSCTPIHTPSCPKGVVYVDGEVTQSERRAKAPLLMEPGQNLGRPITAASAVRYRLGHEAGTIRGGSYCTHLP